MIDRAMKDGMEGRACWGGGGWALSTIGDSPAAKVTRSAGESRAGRPGPEGDPVSPGSHFPLLAGSLPSAATVTTQHPETP